MFKALSSFQLLQQVTCQKPMLRLLSLTANRMAMFTIQDEEDFKTRVMESATPVIVDFHAQ